MKRREFMTLVGGAASLPLAARAQQGNRMPRVGVLRVGMEDSPLLPVALAAFKKALQELGWTDGSNIRIDYRMASPNDVAQIPVIARELLSLKPDVILAQTPWAVAAFQHETKDIPIVFVYITDPVASGFVQSLSHPGGNITGFSNFEPTLVGKYIEILKEIMPGMIAVSEMYYADNQERFRITHPLLEAAARYHAVELITAPVRNDSDIDRAISSLGDNSTKGLIVSGEPFFATQHNLDLIVYLTTRYRVPAVYSFRPFVEAGGLISYGNDLIEQTRQAAAYIDRILKGASPADLPVQAPTKFEMVINLKTAKAMGLTIPPMLLARAD
jgi:putative tryptophan/tyrosine transport system substrate-binding protein